MKTFSDIKNKRQLKQIDVIRVIALYTEGSRSHHPDVVFHDSSPLGEGGVKRGEEAGNVGNFGNFGQAASAFLPRKVYFNLILSTTTTTLRLQRRLPATSLGITKLIPFFLLKGINLLFISFRLPLLFLGGNSFSYNECQRSHIGPWLPVS